MISEVTVLYLVGDKVQGVASYHLREVSDFHCRRVGEGGIIGSEANPHQESWMENFVFLAMLVSGYLCVFVSMYHRMSGE